VSNTQSGDSKEIEIMENKQILKFKIKRLAVEQIKREREQLLRTNLFNASVDEHDINMYKLYNEMESIGFDEGLSNRTFLRLALERCEHLNMYDMIDTKELQDEIKKLIDELN
jgi:predicted HTH transcriptional regulator